MNSEKCDGGPVFNEREASAKRSSREPRLSVITVCKNAVNAVCQTLQSVQHQRGVLVEHVVIDGGSTDGTVKLLRRKCRPGDQVLSENDRGIYDAMNKGLGLATGELVCFLNANDRFADAEVAAKVMEVYCLRYPDVLFGDIIIGDKQPRSYKGWSIASFFDLPLCHQAVFASRRAFQEIGGFDLNYSLAADQDWLLRALRDYRLRGQYLPFTVAYFDDGGISSSDEEEARLRVSADLERTLKNHFTRFETHVYKGMRRLGLKSDSRLCRLITKTMKWDIG